MAQSSNEGSGGKLVDTWIYEYDGVKPKVDTTSTDDGPDEQVQHTVKGIKVSVELRLIKKFSESDKPPQPTKEVWFRVVCKEAGIKLEGTDVELLRKVMWGHLDARYAVKWEEYYLVQIEHQRPYDGIGTGISFGYERVQKGTAWDGTLLLRKDHWAAGRTITIWPGEFQDKAGNALACIPATGANHDALIGFSMQVDKLRKSLAELLRPAKIMATLASLSSAPLQLSIPTDDPAERELEID